MPKFRVTNPQGEKYDITAPDDATEAQVMDVAQTHFAQAAADRKEMEKLADPTAGMSGPEKAAAGAGKFISDIGTGVKQIAASVGIGDKAAPDTEVSESRKRDATLMKSWWAKGGYFAPALAAAFVPGANTAAGSAAIGGGLGALQPVGEGESRLANALVGTVAGTAGQAVGAEVGGAATTALARRAAQRAAAQTTNAGRDAVLAAANESGLAVPPAQANPTVLNRTLEGVGGKIKTAQVASRENQPTINKIIAKDLGLPEDQPITREALAGVRKKAGQAYENLAQGKFETDKIFRDSVGALTERHATLAKELPELSDTAVLTLGKRLSGKDEFSGRTLVDAIGELRDKATKAFTAGDKSLGRVYRGMADEAESLIERNLLAADAAKFNIAKVSGGAYQAPKEALVAFRDARQLIAKSYGAEGALKGSNIDAAKYAQYLSKGKPLSGGSRQVAEFATEFPKAAQLPQRMGSDTPISPLDVAVAILKGGALGTLTLGARPAARSLLLSKWFQKGAAQPSYGSPLVDRMASVLNRENVGRGGAVLPADVATSRNALAGVQ
jgi:hypothetical protein